MSCIYKYKGKDYTKEEFYSLVSNSNFIQQEQAVQARADRLLFQESKWVDQRPGLKEKLINAVDNHNPASEYDGAKLGRNTGETTEISKHTNLNDANKARVAAHETGHYYRNGAYEADEWNKHFDLSKLPNKQRNYLSGDPIRSNISTEKPGLNLSKGEILAKGHGDELRERAAQLKDYIAHKNGISLDKDFVISKSQFDDALKNYVKDTKLDNNMTQFIESIKDKRGLLKTMNKYALGLTGVAAVNQIKE